jgi:hypothetical protein
LPIGRCQIRQPCNLAIAKNLPTAYSVIKRPSIYSVTFEP